jgi:uncharacterized protein (DUF2235 family)
MSPADDTKPLIAKLVVEGEAQNGQASPESSHEAEAIPDKYHLDEIIPPTHDHRTIVLCFDGTGDQFSEDNSNIVQFFSMLRKDNKTQQLVYYQAGIGTYTIPEIATPFMANVSKTIDMMLGSHLDAHIMGGYEFLMQNYDAGDKICIFGFSRGAYTARALAGMIHKVGLLPVCNHQQVPFAYKMYTTDDATGWKQSTAFKRAFSINVDIEFVGVWDTVDAVGLIPRRLPFTQVNDNIKYFRHAMSLDEHRIRFVPSTWYRSTAHDHTKGIKKHEMPRSKPHDLSDHKTHGGRLRHLERQYSESEATTNVEEVWFAGCHCDVGGGSVPNGTRNSLARIPLRWMLRQCFEANTGIMFHKDIFPKVGIDPNTLFPEVLPRPPAIFQDPILHTIPVPRPLVVCDDRKAVVYSDGGSFVNEAEEDLADALSPTYDQLKLAWYWWILELIPQKIKYQSSRTDKMVSELKVNAGRGRHIPLQRKNGVKVHRSVKIRMEAEGLPGVKGKYTPKTKLKVEPKWID